MAGVAGVVPGHGEVVRPPQVSFSQVVQGAGGIAGAEGGTGEAHGEGLSKMRRFPELSRRMGGSLASGSPKGIE